MKNRPVLFTEHPKMMESFEVFESALRDKLQPKDKTPNLSEYERLERATEILARSSLGIYQIVYRYWVQEFEMEYGGKEGRKNMYELLKSKEKQDELVEAVIYSLGLENDWDLQLMAASYYGGPKFVRALKAKRGGSQEFDDFLTKKRYHGYPSVMTYLEGFEEFMEEYAEREGCVLSKVDSNDQIRLFRYAVAKKESDFDMEGFEGDLME